MRRPWRVSASHCNAAKVLQVPPEGVVFSQKRHVRRATQQCANVNPHDGRR